MAQSSKAKIGDFIIITERKVKDNIQPNIKPNDIYYVKKVERTKSGAELLVVGNIKGVGRIHINSDRFSWDTRKTVIKNVKGMQQEVSNEQNDAKAAAQKLEEAQALSIRENFTFDEQAQIAFIPLIIAHIAWINAFKCIDAAAKHKIEITKKLSRTIRMLHENYRHQLGKSLDFNHLKEIETHADMFYNDRMLDFQQMYYSTYNSISKQFIDIEYLDLRAYAYMTLMILRVCREHEDRMTDLIRTKIKDAYEAHLPYLEELQTCVDAFLGDYPIKNTQDMQIAETILKNNIKRIHYVCREQK